MVAFPRLKGAAVKARAPRIGRGGHDTLCGLYSEFRRVNVGSCWGRPLTIGPTRLRSGLGFADPQDQQMGLMTHPALGLRVA